MKFTVITAVRNAGPSLEKTLQSVFAQEGVEVEHIVVDGKSTDGTTELLLRHRGRLAHLIIEADSGPTEALNKALPLATGEFVGFLLAGDWYEPGTLAKVAQLSAGADVVCGRMANWLDGRFEYVSHSEPARLRREMSINFPATFIRAELVKTIGSFDQSVDIATDYDFLLRCYLFGAKFRTVDSVLANMSLDGRSARHWARGYWHAAKSKIRHSGAPVASLCYCVYQLARTSTRVALCRLKLDFIVRAYRAKMAGVRKITTR